ncbi:CHAT domain-containing protein [Nonomuraea sp. NPDC050556]|uniref:CHAT domain-containing protein n=1 Tax=Nonomuraea sp. NPDC050556 TaxID=3364369 RepID=UPI00379FC868
MGEIDELRARAGSFTSAGDEIGWRAELGWALLRSAGGDLAQVEEAVGHALWLLGHWRVTGTLSLAGTAYRLRHALTGAAADRDAAILLLSEVEEGELGWADHAALAELRSQRFQGPLPFGGSRDDLEAMIARWRTAIGACDVPEHRSELRALLGLALARRAVRWPDTAEQDEREADTLLGGLVDAWPDLVGYTLGQIRLARGGRTGERSLLDSGIELIERSLPALTADPEQHHEALSSLAAAHAAKGDLRGSAVRLRELWALLPEDDLPTRAEVSARLGHTLFSLADEDPEVCEEAIEVLRTALRLIGKEGDATLTAGLGTLHLRRFVADGGAEDRETALGLMMGAVATGELDPRFAGLCHLGIGAMLMERADDLPGLDAAIHHLELSEHAGVLLERARDLRTVLTGGFASDADRDRVAEGLRADLAALPPGDPAIPALSALLARVASPRSAALDLAKALMAGVEREPGGVDVDRVLALTAEAERELGEDHTDVRVLRTFGLALRALDDDAFAEAMASLQGLPAEEPFWRELVPTMVAFLLATRFTRTGSLADVDAAASYLSGVKEGLPGVDPAMVRLLNLGVVLAQGMHRESPEAIEGAIAELEEIAARLGPGHPGYKVATALAAQSRNALALFRGGPRPQQPIDLADGVGAEDPYGVMVLLQSARARIDRGVRERDLAMLDTGTNQLKEAIAGSKHPFVTQGLRLLLANALVERHRLGGDGLHEGIAALEQLLDEVGARHPLMAQAPMELAHAYRLRDDVMDARRALDTGLQGLRERYRQVLAQTGTERALAMSKQTSVFALTVASWALDDGFAGLAVHALELGRGLVLAAGTAASSAGGLLRERGEDELAAQWEEAVRRAESGPLSTFGTLDVPSDLRTKVLDRLSGDARLLDPPSARELAGLDGVLVYLLPPVDGRPGRAVVVDAEISVIDLPGLDGGAMERIGIFATLPQASQAWPKVLERLCEVAAEAVVDPLLGHLGEGRHVVLVPWGVLGVVPWHAARGARGYACERARFSVAASGRQALAERAVLPPAAEPVIVSDPGGEVLRWARWECDEVFRLHYPQARRLGRTDAPATGEALLALLPTASVVHFGGHASSMGTSGDSYLLMAGGERLPVETILRHSCGAGVVVLSSCSSDLARGDHDEALTLATALLAAGAASVIGSRWMVGDDPRTAIMMVVFHERLLATGSAGQALHETRAWMLDEGRTLPEGLAAELAEAASSLDFTDPAIWAAFTHQGV